MKNVASFSVNTYYTISSRTQQSGEEGNKSIHNYKIPARDCLLDVSANRFRGWKSWLLLLLGAPQTSRLFLWTANGEVFEIFDADLHKHESSSSKLEFTTLLVEWVEMFRFELSSSSLLGLKSLKFLFMLEKLRFRFSYWTKSVWTNWIPDQRFSNFLRKVFVKSLASGWNFSLQSEFCNNRQSHRMKLYDHRLKSFLSHNVSSLKPQWNAKGIKTLNRNTEMHSRVFPSRLLLRPVLQQMDKELLFVLSENVHVEASDTQCEPGELKQYHSRSISASQSKILCYSRFKRNFWGSVVFVKNIFDDALKRRYFL